MSCSKTITGLCSHCLAKWMEVKKNFWDQERCANCNEVVVVPISKFGIEPDRIGQVLQKIGLLKLSLPNKNTLTKKMWPPKGNTCSRCYQQFDEGGICPCGIDIMTGRPFGQ